MAQAVQRKASWPFQKGRRRGFRGAMRTAVVFGSGGARGWAHVGVLRAFHEAGFRPDMVAGTSIGSIAAAAEAADVIDRFVDFAGDFDWVKAAQLFVEFGVHRCGLVEGRKVTQFLESIIPVREIEALPIPFAAVATDLFTSEEVVFRKGPLMSALRSSISIPGIFTPVEVDGRYLVDGGLVNPLPLDVARAMGATHVVAVNINNALQRVTREEEVVPRPGNLSHAFRSLFQRVTARLDKRSAEEKEKASETLDMNLFDVFTRSLRIAEDRLTTACLEADPPDVLIEPAVGMIPTMDFSCASEAISAGYAAARQALDKQ